MFLKFYAITNPAIVTLSNFLLDVYYINFMQSPTQDVFYWTIPPDVSYINFYAITNS